jgi:uncharacterized protein YdhG (YjbR/CyaY superfamily)
MSGYVGPSQLRWWKPENSMSKECVVNLKTACDDRAAGPAVSIVSDHLYMKSVVKKSKVCSGGRKYAGSGQCAVCWPSRAVNAYIAKAPKEARSKLIEIRKTIRSVAPDALEGISYKMPAFDNGRIAWFASMKGYIGLYLRPPIIKNHKNELVRYKTTKSAIHFPLDENLPITLIKKLIRARINTRSIY